MPELETDQLARLILQKHDCLVQLHEAGRRQLEFVRDGSMAGLLDLLSAKQKLLAQLQRTERALQPFHDQEPESRTWRSEQLRQACSTKIDHCEQLLKAIVAQERESESNLTQRRNEAAEQLQGVHHAGQARGAYMATAQPHNGGLDLSAE